MPARQRFDPLRSRIQMPHRCRSDGLKSAWHVSSDAMIRRGAACPRQKRITFTAHYGLPKRCRERPPCKQIERLWHGGRSLQYHVVGNCRERAAWRSAPPRACRPTKNQNHVHSTTAHAASGSPRSRRVDRRLSRAGDVLDDGRDHEIAGDRSVDSGQRFLGVLGSSSKPRGMDRLFSARHDSAVVLVSRRRGAFLSRSPVGKLAGNRRFACRPMRFGGRFC